MRLLGKILAIFLLELFSGAVHVSSESDTDVLYCEEGVCTRTSNEPIVDPCNLDTHKDCAFWAREGECENNPKYMLNDCPRSCAVCPPLGSEKNLTSPRRDAPCHDIEKTAECERLAGLGECLLEHEFMSDNCKATCFECVNEKDLKANGVSDDEIDRRKRFINMDLGVNQSNPGRDQVELYNTIAQIRAMEKYAKKTMTDPSISSEARSMCKNPIQECAYYASKGLCDTDLVFMMNTCPLACMMCENIEAFHQCVGKRHPSENPFLVKEEYIDYIDRPEEIGVSSLRFFFELLKQEEDKTVHVITKPAKDKDLVEANDPYIFQIDDILTPEECDELIEMGNTIGWTNSTVNKFDNFNGEHGYQMPQRKSETAKCDASGACAEIFDSIILKLSALLEVPSSYFEIPQMDLYSPGGYYTGHHDFRKHDEYKPAGPRVLSIYLILSEAASGGSIGFPNMDFLLVKPKRGSLLIWPNVDGALHFDEALKKEIMPVREGNLRLLHTHVHLYDLPDPTEKGCE